MISTSYFAPGEDGGGLLRRGLEAAAVAYIILCYVITIYIYIYIYI